MAHFQTFDHTQFTIKRNVINTKHQFIDATLGALGLTEFPEGFFIKGREHTVLFKTHNVEMASSKQSAVYLASDKNKIAEQCIVTLLKS